MSLPEYIILFLIFLLVYIYFLYPAIVIIASKLFEKPVNESTDYEPELTILIAAYNEENYIEDCIRSIYVSDYPVNKIKVIVGDDGSTDDTHTVLMILKNEFSSLSFYHFERSGKNKVLNELYKYVTTDIILFLDADCRLTNNSLRSMMSKFADKNVGAVLASLQIQAQTGFDNVGRFGESTYQKYESKIRESESKLHSSLNSFGAYSIKREIYQILPNDNVCDDFYTILNVAKHGKRVIYDNTAIVNEIREKSLKDEFQRRIRLVAGGLSTIGALKILLLPGYGWVCFSLWSHKLLRWLTPFLMIGVIVSTFLIGSHSQLFLPITIAQLILFSGAVLSLVLEYIKVKLRLLQLLLFFVSMNLSFLFGIFRFIIKRQNAKWERFDTRL